MTHYKLTFGPRSNPRKVMEVYAPSSSEAVERHLCLALPGERMSSESLDKLDQDKARLMDSMTETSE